jgi:signal peptidase
MFGAGKVIIWGVFLFGAFIVIYLVMNRNVKLSQGTLSKKLSKRRKDKKAKALVAKWKGLIIPTKKGYPFLALIPFIIIVYIFINHMLFFAVITSDSMSPTFEKGDLVLMQSVDTDAEDDEIIMFNDKNPRGTHPPVIHRVENITEDGIKTKGDATNKIDDWVIEEDEVSAKAVTTSDGNPIVIPEVGNYFIQDYKAQGKYASEFVFTSLMIATLKDMGLVIFAACVGLYIVLSLRDVYKSED